MKRKNRILIIDDDEATVRLHQRVFRNKYELMTANNGEAGLKLVPEFRPDLILLDIDMPGLNGYETCKMIKEDDTLSLIKVLLVSGHSKLDERLKGYEVGADDYVAKPFDNNELRAKVDVFMKLKRVEEIDNIKSNLLSLFSHETRTPLSGIIGISELLMYDDSISESTKDKVSLIYKSSLDLYKFIEKAALLSNLKGGMDLHYVSGSLRQHLENLKMTRDAEAKSKNICMNLDCPDDIEFMADWNTLDEVLGYILDNAVKYTKKDSQVVTRAQMAGQTCTIEISDEGEGIDPTWIDSIFDEFAIRDIMHHKQGQGLSLAIAKQVVELHSGQISVDSQEGQGATFTVKLPILEMQQTTSP